MTTDDFTTKPYDCGCNVVLKYGEYFYPEAWRIIYCPRHAAADAMFETLKRALDDKYLWQIEAQAALAKAEGDDDG